MLLLISKSTKIIKKTFCCNFLTKEWFKLYIPHLYSNTHGFFSKVHVKKLCTTQAFGDTLILITNPYLGHIMLASYNLLSCIKQAQIVSSPMAHEEHVGITWGIPILKKKKKKTKKKKKKRQGSCQLWPRTVAAGESLYSPAPQLNDDDKTTFCCAFYRVY